MLARHANAGAQCVGLVSDGSRVQDKVSGQVYKVRARAPIETLKVLVGLVTRSGRLDRRRVDNSPLMGLHFHHSRSQARQPPITRAASEPA